LFPNYKDIFFVLWWFLIFFLVFLFCLDHHPRLSSFLLFFPPNDFRSDPSFVPINYIPPSPWNGVARRPNCRAAFLFVATFILNCIQKPPPHLPEQFFFLLLGGFFFFFFVAKKNW
jgi:hypothetical protein